MMKILQNVIRRRLYLWLILLGILAGFLAGCATPEGGSSLPWTERESWEDELRLGVPY